MYIICENNYGKNFEIAKTISKKLNTKYLSLSSYKNINSILEHNDDFIFVCQNTGDEELPKFFEKFLIKLKVKNKKYSIIEIGNYFGYEIDFFGSKLIIRNILKSLNWQEKYHCSIDCLPKINKIHLKNCLSDLRKLYVGKLL